MRRKACLSVVDEAQERQEVLQLEGVTASERDWLLRSCGAYRMLMSIVQELRKCTSVGHDLLLYLEILEEVEMSTLCQRNHCFSSFHLGTQCN